MCLFKSSIAKRSLMFLSKVLRGMRDACVEKYQDGWTIGSNQLIKGFLFLATITLSICLPSIATCATYTINVSLSTSAINPIAIQQDILSNLTTGQYLGTWTASPFFANTYSVTVKGKNPTYTGPSVSTTLLSLDTIADKLTKISTDTFVYGYVNGVAKERNEDLRLVGDFFVHCDSPTYFNGSPGTWSKATCTDALGSASSTIYQQNFSTATFIIQGF